MIATINNVSSVHDNCGLVTVANAINVPLSDTSTIATYPPLADRDLVVVARLVARLVARELAAVARLVDSAVTFKVVCSADSDLELELVAVSIAHLVAPGISLNVDRASVDRAHADRHAAWADLSKAYSMVYTAVFAAWDAVLVVAAVERDVPPVAPSATATFRAAMEVVAVAARVTRRTLQ